MKVLHGTTAVLTGASRGIGVHIARALAEQGVNLSLAARSEDELGTVRSQMVAIGVRAIATKCDVTSAVDRQHLIERTTSELGPVDILVNNAGIDSVSRFDEADEQQLVSTIDVNLVAAMLLTRAVLPGMLERRRGHVVNIASGAGKIGVPYAAAYAASKHGLVGLTNSLRAEYHGSPVGFSAVCPGLVSDTGMFARYEQRGVRGLKTSRRSAPDKVAEVVVSSIRKNRGEVLVNGATARPVTVLANIAPGILPQILRLTGYTRAFERVADVDKA
jgi:short-subunit dehydrogenase